MSQVAKLIDFMTPFGRTITARQARQYFGVQNLSARVREMRIDGGQVHQQIPRLRVCRNGFAGRGQQSHRAVQWQGT